MRGLTRRWLTLRLLVLTLSVGGLSVSEDSSVIDGGSNRDSWQQDETQRVIQREAKIEGWSTGDENPHPRPRRELTPPLYYFRIPKTGSTALVQAIMHTSAPSPMIVCVDHAFGCPDVQYCNASDPRYSDKDAFAVLREPCDRFESQYFQMKRKRPELLVESWSPESFLTLLETLCPGPDGCPPGVDFPLFDDHRVIIWPQSFFINQRTHVLCYDSKLLEPRARDFVREGLGLDLAPFERHNTRDSISEQNEEQVANAREDREFEMTPSMCARIRSYLFPADFRLWETHCN